MVWILPRRYVVGDCAVFRIRSLFQDRQVRALLMIVMVSGILLAGCQSVPRPCAPCEAPFDPCSQHPDTGGDGPARLAIEYADVTRCSRLEPADSQAPRTAADAPPKDFWDLSLQQAIQLALQRGDVLKDLGGRIVSAPDATGTVFDPAIREADPLFGVEAALSAFDAQTSTSLFWQQNDRVFNNVTLGGGVNEFRQDLTTFQTEISKTAATGTRFGLRHLTLHDANNARDNLFASAWDTQFVASVRHPLLQGGSVEFNRIAGPNAQPGFNFSSGVLIARIDSDIALADFQVGVRNFLSQVEDAYWELYFAYRELDSKVVARDSALETWRIIRAKFIQRLEGGEALNEARAREQYYMLQDQVEEALSGATGGRSTGVYRGERRLRRLLGLPVNDGRLIRPSEEPGSAPIALSWQAVLTESLQRRVELRRQAWKVKRREMELVAAKNFTQPRLDAVAQYRIRGFGDDLTGRAGGPLGSAFRDLKDGDHHEWEVGFQLDVPVGFRRAWSGVRQAELKLAREQAILDEQERQIEHDLADAVAELERARTAVRNGFNRVAAAVQHRDATQAAFNAERVPVDMVLDAQERLALAQTRYYRSLTDYALARKSVHFHKGSLLEYNGVLLSEGSWPAGAYQSASRNADRWVPKRHDARVSAPEPFSTGPAPQHFAPTDLPERLPTTAPDP